MREGRKIHRDLACRLFGASEEKTANLISISSYFPFSVRGFPIYRERHTSILRDPSCAVYYTSTNAIQC